MKRVLVVDDSQFMRSVVDNALTDAGYEVETATNGREAVDAVETSQPDVVTMDVEMPEMDGIEAVERIMSSRPTPILMLSAYTAEGAESTLDALERGAMDVLQKPDGTDSRTIVDLADELVDKVDEVANTDVSSLALARAAAAIESVTSGRVRQSAVVSMESIGATSVGTGSTAVEVDDSYLDDPTIVVGASTGGPKILERLFATLPIELGAKLLVVQHMPAEFTERLANRLDEISEYDVSEATHGDLVGAGEALVAPGGHHLEVSSNIGGQLRVRLDDGERVHSVRPAIDVTMKTAANRVTDPLVGVALTGMGRDGAAGIEAIKSAGGRTIAQDEETSPVFGIPKQAIETGCVDEVVPAPSIADRIVDAFRTEGEYNE
ncbi:chemotaxis-specific protein-glutamate methyltransferase CheB [Natronobeatus ordinarius]|uniref:chemotaxis-specific protein-glutamate methyltransferase CheB n=1 Tax=Natronobeatus ordinarius TaxID=2963433 RepID=UPI0020CC5F1F|nr:chemotaxis-specific protein-glutamate methyltransferase CheB [Natronobeatus ordinarius]